MSRTTSEGDEEWPASQPHHSPPFHKDGSGSSSKRRRLHSQRDNGATRETGIMREGASHDASRFVGSASGIHFIRTVTQALARTGDGTRAASNAIGDLVPGEDDQLVEETPGGIESPMSTARVPFWQDEELAANARHSTLTLDNFVAWTQSYFDNWHPLFPFLHGPQVLELLERVEHVGINNVSEADATIVRSLVSISLADSRQMAQYKGPRDPSFLFLSQGDVASGLLFAMGSPASLKGVQAALCVQLFLVSMLRFNMASRLGGIIVRMAFHLGLHRCPFRFPHFSREEAMMRKRIWWSLYSLERMICQSLGHPLGIADDDVDVCLPTCELHGGPHVDDSTDGQGADQLTLLTLLSQHARLRGSILELRNKSIAQRNDTVDRAMTVQSELSSWANHVHEIVDDDGDVLNASDRLTTVSQVQSNLLSILQHEATVALNRPLLASRTTSPSSRAALQTCIGSSRAILNIIMSRELPLQDDSARNAVMIWPLLTWSVWMSCFILVYAALEDTTTTQSALRYAKKAQRILEQLSRRGTSWPDRCLQAVRHLVSVLHPHDQDRSGGIVSQRGRSSESSGRRRRSAYRQPPLSSPQTTCATMGEASVDTLAQSTMPDNTRVHEHLVAQPRPRFSMFDNNPAATQTSLFDPSPETGEAWDHLGIDPLSVIDFSNFAQDGDARWAFEPGTD